MPKLELTQGEINSYSTDIYKILTNVPLFFLHEVMENAMEGRVKDGADDDLDVSDSDSEDECLGIESSSEEDTESEEEEV